MATILNFELKVALANLNVHIDSISGCAAACVPLFVQEQSSTAQTLQ